MSNFPAEFETRIRTQLGEATDQFFSTLAEPAVVSILTNRDKPPTIISNDTTTVPWCPYGKFLTERPQFTLDPEFHAGTYYVMESASMLLWEALSSFSLPSGPLKVLDLCAAPGGKSMLLSNWIHADSVLVSNEVNRKRYQILKENSAKWGRPNVYLSNYDPSAIPLDGYFDIVVTDAPCSGEGLFRKTPEAIDEWSTDNVKLCSARQKRILAEAARLVKPGGHLIYSTCTYNHEENIRNVVWLTEYQDFNALELNNTFNTEPVSSGSAKGYQCWPHRMRGEGFFVSVLQKGLNVNGDKWKSVHKDNRSWLRNASAKLGKRWFDWTDRAADLTIRVDQKGTYYAYPLALSSTFATIEQALPYGMPNLVLGEIKGEDIVPHHRLALSTVRSNDLPIITLNDDTALTYLKRDRPDVESSEQGWHLASYSDAHSLGWIKMTNRGPKNYFPMNLRIRMTV